jgi:outer membrane receptor for ferrienterochelin and colicin
LSSCQGGPSDHHVKNSPKQIQINGFAISSGGAANVNQLLNAEHAQGFGVETEFDLMVTDNLFVSANLSYTGEQNSAPISNRNWTLNKKTRPCAGFFQSSV